MSSTLSKITPNQPLARPGVSPAWLMQNSVQHVCAEAAQAAVGINAAGLLIPYRNPFDRPDVPICDPADTPFARLRLDQASGDRKYHQPAGTQVHGYLPTFDQCPSGSSPLVLVEGEFKSLCLTDPEANTGTYAVGLGGFYGFALNGAEGQTAQLVPELASAIQNLRPSVVHFLGDNDTALNPQFADATLKLKALLPGVEIRLPRIHLDEPKGIDDVREDMRAKFPTWFADLINDAILLDRQDVDTLRLQLVEPEIMHIKSLSTDARMLAVRRLAKLAQACGPDVQGEIIRMVKSEHVLSIMDFRRLIQSCGDASHTVGPAAN